MTTFPYDTENMTWDDLSELVTRWERLPINFRYGFPHSQLINHEGYVYRYTFSRNTTGQFLVMHVVRMYDNRVVFHGRINPWDIHWGRDPVLKMRRFLWFAHDIDFDEEIINIYVFYVPDWIKTE